MACTCGSKTGVFFGTCALLCIVFLTLYSYGYTTHLVTDSFQIGRKDAPLNSYIPLHSFAGEQPDVSPSIKCSHEIFRKYYQGNNRFPGAGQWITDSHNITRFHPDLCRLDYQVDAKDVFSYLKRENISYIMAVGDSNGNRQFRALIGVFKALPDVNCIHNKYENRVEGKYTPDKRFFSYQLEPGQHVTVRQGDCGTCRAGSFMCHRTGDPDFRLKLGFLTMYVMRDETIQVRDDSNAIVVNNTQEFYFKMYLKNRYPDLMIMYMPFHHIKAKPIDVFRKNFQTVRTMLHQNAPPSTRIAYVPCHGEFESVRTAIKFKYKRYNGMYADKAIHALNQALFAMIKNDLVKSNDTLGFFDLWSLGSDRVGWCEDGVHMNGLWYNNTAEMFLETLIAK